MSWRSILIKTLLLLTLALIIGVPIVHTAQVLVALGLLLVVVLGRLRVPGGPGLGRHLAIFAGLFAAGMLLPAVRIEEGHNLFLVDGERHEPALKAAMPAAIYEYAKAQFLHFHPAGEGCGPEDTCWRSGKPIGVPFAFSPDGALQHPLMSKVTDLPDFEGLHGFRAGFKNVQGSPTLPSTNWYEWESRAADPVRANMPFFVVYQIPAGLVGQNLCATGDRFWVPPVGAPVHSISHDYKCARISRADVGARLYGLSIDPRLTLGVRLKLEPTWPVVANLARLLTRLLAAVLLTVIFIVADARALFRFAAVTVLPALVAGPWLFAAFQNPFFGAGTDPLTHWGYGQRILQAASTGDWREAARGAEDVFYFMPGYRYFHALEMAVFGDSGFLSFAALFAYPCLIATLARRLGGPLLAFTALPLTYLAFAIMAQNLYGWAEMVGYPAFMAALCALLPDDRAVAGLGPKGARPDQSPIGDGHVGKAELGTGRSCSLGRRNLDGAGGETAAPGRGRGTCDGTRRADARAQPGLWRPLRPCHRLVLHQRKPLRRTHRLRTRIAGFGFGTHWLA